MHIKHFSCDLPTFPKDIVVNPPTYDPIQRLVLHSIFPINKYVIHLPSLYCIHFILNGQILDILVFNPNPWFWWLIMVLWLSAQRNPNSWFWSSDHIIYIMVLDIRVTRWLPWVWFVWFMVWHFIWVIKRFKFKINFQSRIIQI